MAGQVDAVEAAARIETALDRLAGYAQTHIPVQHGPDPLLQDVAARLDYLITQLREALAEDHPAEFAAVPEAPYQHQPVAEPDPPAGPPDQFPAQSLPQGPEEGPLQASDAQQPYAGQFYSAQYYTASYGTPEDGAPLNGPPPSDSWQ